MDLLKSKKSDWGVRGMNAAGMFVEEDSSKPDAWKNASKSNKLIKKFGGEIFSATRLMTGSTPFWIRISRALFSSWLPADKR